MRLFIHMLAIALLASCYASERVFTETTQHRPVVDPTQSVDLPSGRILARMHRALFRFQGGSLAPEIAESFHWKGDTLHLHLRANIAFCDGSGLVAGDVVFSLNRLLGRIPGQARGAKASQYDWITSLSASSTTDVTIGTRQRNPSLLRLLTLPASYIYKMDGNGQIQGAGAYCLASLSGGEIRLTPNPHFRPLPGDLPGKPLPTGIRFILQPDEAASRFLFLKGDLDVFRVPPYYVSSMPAASLVSIPPQTVYYVAINHKNRDLDVHFRQAANQFLDRRLIVEKLLHGHASLSASPIPPPMRTNTACLPKEDHDLYSIKEGTMALQKSRYALEPRQLQFYHKSDIDSSLLAREIANKLRRSGIEVKTFPVDRNLLLRKNAEGHGDLFLFNWTADYPESADFLIPTFHSSNVGNGGNRAFVQDKVMDSYLEQVRSGDAQAICKADAWLRQDFSWIFLFFPIEYVALSRTVKRYPMPATYAADRGIGIEWDIPSPSLR